MNKKQAILYEIQVHGYQSQRTLAAGTQISVGLVNSLLKELQHDGELQKAGKTYQLTAKGEQELERLMRSGQEKKMSVGRSHQKVRSAVILAAGGNANFCEPVGLLPIGGIPMIEYAIRYLAELGITRICVVTGYEKKKFYEYFQNRPIDLVDNDRYHWTGTMASLARAAEWIRDDFLLIESNQIFEKTALEKLLECPSSSAMLLVNPSGSTDEAYVELDDAGDIFRISKDIRQMNQIDGELVGISKISYELFQKMMEYYGKNENPWLNYEYVIETLSRIYQIPGIRVDDLPWTVAETAELYEKAQHRVYHQIQKRERLRKQNEAQKQFQKSMGIPQEAIREFRVCGGMTNTNFYVRTEDEEYVIRIPGAGTDQMIVRRQEKINGELAAQLGINVPAYYFDVDSGVKISPYIEDAQTLNPKTACMEGNMKRTAQVLRTLHTSEIVMDHVFSVQEEYEKYKRQAKDAGAVLYEHTQEMDVWFNYLMDRLQILGVDSRPCHNDLVPENLIRDKNGRMYLIDWEYAGVNDPMWDLASHFLECEFQPDEEELFLQYYLNGDKSEHTREKIMIYKMCQDILWSMWTLIKEAKGENFGSYGRDRLARAVKMRREYEKQYETHKK